MILWASVYPVTQVSAACLSPTAKVAAGGSASITENCTVAADTTEVYDYTTSENSINAAVITISATVTLNSGVSGNTTFGGGSYTLGAGGSIAVGGSNIQVKPGYPIWVADTDADGFPNSLSTLYTSTASGRRRLGLMRTTTTDCNDNSFSLTNACSGGTGSDGAITVSSDKRINYHTIASGRSYADGIAYRVSPPSDGATSVSRYSGSDTLSNGIAAGDEVLIIVLQGTTSDMDDVGNYEFMTVSSSTASTITFSQALGKSYNGAGGALKVVVQRVPNYTSVTINSGGWINTVAFDRLVTTPSGTAGYYTGIIALRASGTVTVNSGGGIWADQKGFRGGTGGSRDNGVYGGDSFCGNGGTPNGGAGAGGAGSVYTTGGTGYCGGGGGTWYTGGDGSNTKGGAGGGASSGPGGGGAGYGTAGGGGVGYYSGGGGGTNYSGDGGNGGGNAPSGGGGGGTYGDANLSKLYLGSGGGQGGSTHQPTAGGTGGGIIYIGANTITNNGGVITAGGQAGGSVVIGNTGGGGGGSGGSIYLYAQTVTLGTTRALYGSGGTGSWFGTNYYGGAGGYGRIAVDADSISGSSTPSYTQL